MIGNKNDITNDQRQISFNEANFKISQIKQNMNKKNNEKIDILFLGEASCKTGENIEHFINKGMELVIENAIKCEKCGLLKVKHNIQNNNTYKYQYYENDLQFPWENI